MLVFRGVGLWLRKWKTEFMFPGAKFSIEASNTLVIQSDDWDALAWMIAMIPKISGFFDVQKSISKQWKIRDPYQRNRHMRCCKDFRKKWRYSIKWLRPEWSPEDHRMILLIPKCLLLSVRRIYDSHIYIEAWKLIVDTKLKFLKNSGSSQWPLYGFQVTCSGFKWPPFGWSKGRSEEAG